jgi:hypothetical protein
MRRAASTPIRGSTADVRRTSSKMTKGIRSARGAVTIMTNRHQQRQQQ